MDVRDNLRSITIVAHVDHGKTTLVDQLPRQSGIFRVNEAITGRVMNSSDLEREHGITILSKNTAVMYDGTKIDIVGTPDHADFGGEVRRILMMVDGVLLLVDASKGCMPQARFVLRKALGPDKKSMVIVNKIGRPDACPLRVTDEVLGLFIEFNANEGQLRFPVVYASNHDDYITLDPDKPEENMVPLFESILRFVPASQGDLEDLAQMLFSSTDYGDYLGRIGVGHVERGRIRDDQSVVLCGHEDGNRNTRIVKLYQFEGLKRVEVAGAAPGSTVAVSDVTGLNIDEMACASDCVEPLPFVKIDESTASMMFMVNNDPFANKGSKFATSRNLYGRLFKEVEANVALRMEETDSADTFKVPGCGELHLSTLIEAMRRQNYGPQVSCSSVIYKTIGGKRCEPIELLMIEVPDQYVGAVVEKLSSRKVETVNVSTRESGVTRMEFKIPACGLMGYHPEFSTDTNGSGIINHVFDSYEPYCGDIIQRAQDSLAAHRTGSSIAYGLSCAQDRDRLFIGAGMEVYEDMIVGTSPKQEDITVNIYRKKHTTSTRASGSDDALELTPHMVFSPGQPLEFITEDELMGTAPKSIRMRKMILNKEQRMKQSSRKK